MTAIASGIVLDHRTKGIPGLADPFPLSAIADRKWNVLRGDMPLPLAVLKESALDNNARWISEFISKANVSLCPHGKTTMSPALFRRQLAGGAWGITLSTSHQVQVGRDFGLKRILLANQIVDPAFADYVLSEIDDDPTFDFYCLVDSVEIVDFLTERARRRGAERPLQVLIEVGMTGGRTGCRTLDQALAVARRIKDAAPYLALRGVEGFEGIVPMTAVADPSPVRTFLDFMQQVAVSCSREQLFAAGEIILSAGGSAYFDIVAESLSKISLDQPRRVVLRSGCYVSHDSSMYVTYFDAIRKRSELARSIEGQFKPAIELFAYVQSRPEPALALLTLGKRDCSYDHKLPIPNAFFRPGRDAAPRPLTMEFTVSALNDQHAFLQIPEKSDLAVGDMIILGVSHPCTTFDKWDVVYGVDDDYNVVSAFKTYF